MADLQKYLGFFLMEYQRVRFYFTELVVRSLIISIRLALPYSVFQVLVKTGQITQNTANAMLWAVLIGQILYGSNIRLHTKVRDEIRSGDISIRISEPVNYVLAKLAQSFGKFFPTFIAMSAIFFPILLYLFPSKINLPLLTIFTIISFVVTNLINMIIGLSSFVIEENDGIFYIVSKLFLIFGNQIIPVALMPLWVIQLAKLTPFYYGLAAPIEAASGRLNWLEGLGISVAYIVILYLISQLMLSKLRKRLILNG
jgi:ABC-2 type transport system permease protein